MDIQLAGSLTKEGAGPGKVIFEGGFKFSAFEAWKNFDSIDLADRGVIRE